jgi:hypothetical protein
VQRTDSGLAAVGAERRLAIWFARYATALIALVLFVAGDVVFALLLIVLSEVVFLTLRPRPKFGPSTYRPPAPDQWQTPITVLRWTSLISNVWAIVTGALLLTIVSMIVIVVLVVIGWRHGLGVSNFVVLALFGLWLLTRPLWIAPLRRALKVEATRQLAPYMATLHVGTDGVEVDMRPAFIRRAPESYRFSVGFAELDEVRIMDGLTAQGYWGVMGQYDPTIVIRMEWELLHFVADQKARPSILGLMGFGTHLLLRGPTLLYLIGNADPFAVDALTAWQAWRGAHPAPATPTAQDSSSRTV